MSEDLGESMSDTTTIAAINKAVGAHGAWKLKLRTAISHNKSDVVPELVARDDQCEFGKWLNGPTIPPEMRSGIPYGVIKRLHADFHKCAATVLQKAINGHPDALDLLEGEFSDRSKTLVTALSKWKGELG